MSIVVIGVNHRTGPLALLERVADPGTRGAQGHHRPDQPAEHPRGRRADARATAPRSTPSPRSSTAPTPTSATSSASSAAWRPTSCTPTSTASTTTAPSPTCSRSRPGLDSAVLGESEILGQVRNAWELAQVEGGAKATLNLLFRTAVETGKRARTETNIGRGTASVSHAAVEMATERLGSLAGKRVLVVGAGDMGEGIATALVGAGATDISVTNRTIERAEQLAARVDGRVIPFGKLPTAISSRPTCCSPAPAPAACWSTSTRWSPGASGPPTPLLVVDIAVPRDVAPEVTELAGVTLLNLDDLRDWADRGLAQRASETERVRAIVGEEIERYLLEAAARQAAPLVAQLHEQAEADPHRRAGALRHPPGRVRRCAAGHRRRGHQGHRRQAAPPAVRAAEGRRRHAAGRAQRRRGARPVRPLLIVLRSPRRPRRTRCGWRRARARRPAPRRRCSPTSCAPPIRASTSRWCSSTRWAISWPTSRCTRSAGRASSSRRSSEPCSPGTPTWRCTPPRICRPRRPTG